MVWRSFRGLSAVCAVRAWAGRLVFAGPGRSHHIGARLARTYPANRGFRPLWTPPSGRVPRRSGGGSRWVLQGDYNALDPPARPRGIFLGVPQTPPRGLRPPPMDSLVWTGHMVAGCSETWWTHLSMLGIVPEVKLGDLMSGEEDVPDSIVSCRTNSHWHALEGLRYLEDTAKELEPTFVVNTAYQVGWFVLQGWKDLGKQSLAHLVLGGRSSKVKGVMGPLQVVDVPPQVEGSLAVRQISEAAPLQHFNGHGSVEALIFSLCLRVIRASMTDSDAQPQQPDCKRCVGVVLVMAPRGAIVHRHCVGQAVSAGR